jgi:hypothetical protein
MEPALAALLFRVAIPGDAERLIAPPGKGDQVLLQRIDPEGVGDLVIAKSPIVVLRADQELWPRSARKVVTTPNCSNRPSAKSPSTVASVAFCMASAWYEPRQLSVSAAWQPEQTWPPMNFAGSSASA